MGGESFPIEVADRLLAGEKAVRVYRDPRGMTQKQLAKSAGINVLYLAQIERGRRKQRPLDGERPACPSRDRDVRGSYITSILSI